MTRPIPAADERFRAPGRQKQNQRVIVENYHGEKFVGSLHDAGSTELVILCHGLQSSKAERIPMGNLAAALENKGISAFRFHFAGNGESEGLFRFGNYYREADDLRAVVQHFREDKYIIITIIGHSKGQIANMLNSETGVILLEHQVRPKVIINDRRGRHNLEQ